MPKRKAGKALLDGFNPISEWEERVEVAGDVKVLIFYAGPHPDDGKYSVCIDCDDE